MENFFQTYGEKIGFILAEILGAIWIYIRTKKKKTPEEKEAEDIAKQEAKTLKAIENAKKEGQKLEDMKGAKK